MRGKVSALEDADVKGAIQGIAPRNATIQVQEYNGFSVRLAQVSQQSAFAKYHTTFHGNDRNVEMILTSTL